jgi:hypothetical protein
MQVLQFKLHLKIFSVIKGIKTYAGAAFQLTPQNFHVIIMNIMQVLHQVTLQNFSMN